MKTTYPNRFIKQQRRPLLSCLSILHVQTQTDRNNADTHTVRFDHGRPASLVPPARILSSTTADWSELPENDMRCIGLSTIVWRGVGTLSVQHRVIRYRVSSVQVAKARHYRRQCDEIQDARPSLRAIKDCRVIFARKTRKDDVEAAPGQLDALDDD